MGQGKSRPIIKLNMKHIDPMWRMASMRQNPLSGSTFFQSQFRGKEEIRGY